MIAALYVDVERGPYRALGADCWGESRDARLYAGPWPVVAHPPCQSWSKLARMAGRVVGDDAGCFEAAVNAVRRCGGVLEHPHGSAAWSRFSLPPWGAPHTWRGTPSTGWTALVHQSRWGHVATKPTLLWAFGGARAPSLPFPPAAMTRPRTVESMHSSKRHLTPVRFAEWLLSVAKEMAHP